MLCSALLCPPPSIAQLFRVNELITKLPHVDADELEAALAAYGETEEAVPEGAVVPEALRDAPLYLSAHAALLTVKQFVRAEYGLSDSRVQARQRGRARKLSRTRFVHAHRQTAKHAASPPHGSESVVP